MVAAYRKLGYAVVAISRSVDSADPEVLAVALGIITPMHPADNHETLAGLHLLDRIGEIDDVVEAIVYLDQARFVTGEICTSTAPKRRPPTTPRTGPP